MAIVGAIVLVGAIAAGAPSEISDRIDEFTEPVAPDPTAGASRYESLSGNGRYQLWTSAVDANATEPLTGIGPGTFEYWWTEDRPLDAYARSAHSLYLNSLAEVGIVGHAADRRLRARSRSGSACAAGFASPRAGSCSRGRSAAR